jgi:hypothetical protein
VKLRVSLTKARAADKRSCSSGARTSGSEYGHLGVAAYFVLVALQLRHHSQLLLAVRCYDADLFRDLPHLDTYLPRRDTTPPSSAKDLEDTRLVLLNAYSHRSRSRRVATVAIAAAVRKLLGLDLLDAVVSQELLTVGSLTCPPTLYALREVYEEGSEGAGWVYTLAKKLRLRWITPEGTTRASQEALARWEDKEYP